MTKQFHGLCLGGPADGERRTHSAPQMRAIVPEPLPKAFAPLAGEQKPVSMAMETVTYHHEIIAIHKGATGGMGHVELGIWRLENETLFDAMLRLFKGYRPKGSE